MELSGEQKIQNVLYCHKCGAKAAANVTVCANCGTKLGTPANTNETTGSLASFAQEIDESNASRIVSSTQLFRQTTESSFFDIVF